MIIYQLHETSGEYNDYMDRIVGSYMRRERAEEEKAKREKELISKNSFISHCLFCFYRNSWYVDNVDNKKLIAKMAEYCDHSNIVVDEDGAVICKEYAGCNFDYSEFYIEEVEVIE